MLLETSGVFLGSIDDASIELKNGFPRAIWKLTTNKFFAESPQDQQHYGIMEPAYVDFPETQITAFLSLYKKNGEENYHYADLCRAVGWSGAAFDELSDGSLRGRQIMFKTEVNTYEGKTSLQVKSIGNKDDSPTRELKKLDVGSLKEINAKFGKKKVAPKPVAVAAVKPAIGVVPKPSVIIATVTDITMEDAWLAVCEKQPDEQQAAATFEEACQVVAPNGSHDDITKGGQWHKVRGTALAKLSA